MIVEKLTFQLCNVCLQFGAVYIETKCYYGVNEIF